MTNYKKYRESYIKAKKKYNSKPEVKEKRKEYMKKYRKEHKEEIRIARQKYRDRDINKFNEINRMYQRKRREKYKENAELVIKYKEVLDKIKDKTNKMIESNNSALSNPEYTIVSKHQLLKLSNEELKNILELLEEIE